MYTISESQNKNIIKLHKVNKYLHDGALNMKIVAQNMGLITSKSINMRLWSFFTYFDLS